MHAGAPATVSFALDGVGWADCRIGVGDQEFTIAGFGYCLDSFGDLARAALAMATGGWEARVRFDGEPHEWRLVLRRQQTFEAPARLSLQVLEFPDVGRNLPDAEGRQSFVADVEVDAFAQAVLDGLTELATEGVEKFNVRWHGIDGFPSRAVAALSSALATTPTPGPTDSFPTGGGWQIVADGAGDQP